MTRTADILQGKAPIVDDKKANVLLLDVLQSGARNPISKPFDLDEVLARFRNNLEVHLKHAEANNFINALAQMIQEIETISDPQQTHRGAGLALEISGNDLPGANKELQLS